MNLRNLECDPSTLIGPVDQRVVDEIQTQCPLDAEFLAYMGACHGGVPRIGALEIDGNWYRIGLFLSLIDVESELPGPFRPHFDHGETDERAINSISYVKFYEHMTSRALFGGLLPFAACQADMQLDHACIDLFCLDYRQGRFPRPVVLWDAHKALRAHMKWDELPPEECFDEAGEFKSVPWDEFLKFVAPNFESFVEMLQPVSIYYCSIRESFREVMDPRWLTSAVCELARQANEDEGSDLMPILADALMDAGCDNELILAHCRSGGAHEKGCWVLDLILGSGRNSADSTATPDPTM